MNHIQNVILTGKQKSNNSPINSWTFVLQQLEIEKTDAPNSKQKIQNKRSSFIADWELPKVK